MSVIIHLTDHLAKRSLKNAPDANCVTHVDGREWFKFGAVYRDGDKEFCIDFWALDEADALRRIGLMCSTLKYDGQILAEIDE